MRKSKFYRSINIGKAMKTFCSSYVHALFFIYKWIKKKDWKFSNKYINEFQQNSMYLFLKILVSGYIIVWFAVDLQIRILNMTMYLVNKCSTSEICQITLTKTIIVFQIYKIKNQGIKKNFFWKGIDPKSPPKPALFQLTALTT